MKVEKIKRLREFFFNLEENQIDIIKRLNELLPHPDTWFSTEEGL